MSCNCYFPVASYLLSAIQLKKAIRGPSNDHAVTHWREKISLVDKNPALTVEILSKVWICGVSPVQDLCIPDWYSGCLTTTYKSFRKLQCGI